jgi:uracil-DNA glycosylase
MDVPHRLDVLHAPAPGLPRVPRDDRPADPRPPIATKIVLVGQAPGPREGALGRPFAWTAGKTLFRWFQTATGIDEDTFRRGIYITAVARCFPGKASGGGDRRPDATEIASCQTLHL